jgi:nucleolar protein 14
LEAQRQLIEQRKERKYIGCVHVYELSMAKRKSYSKKSISRLPKGLPIRNNSHGATKGKTTSTQSTTNSSANPFEITQRMKRPKFAVHNRGSAATTSQQQPQRMSALAEALSKRQTAIVTAIQQQKKANIFTDQRIGESNNNPKNEEMMMLSNDAKNLARLVRERARQSKRISKYSLQGDLDNDAHQLLTHKGRAITDMADVDHVMLSDDDEEEDGNLDAYDTAMHFGGKGISDPKFNSTYGNTDSAGTNLSNAYSQKKQDLDDMIMRRKVMKLERLKSRELQVDKFEAMDQSFAELASVLQFRDKEQEIRQKIQLKRTGGELSPEDQEHDDWEREMKQYLYVERKVAATDRTKTPEEIAKEEAEKLHQLETRRLARMNGDIDDDDDLSDIDSNHPKQSKRRKVQQQGKIKYNNAEALDNDSDVEQDKDDRTTRFTSEGLVYVNKEGVVIGKVEDVDNNDSDDESVSVNDQSEGDDESVADSTVYNVGDKVTANYRATEQYDGHNAWYSGTITAVVVDDNNVKTYNIEYDDGDFEDAVEPRHIKPAELSIDEVQSNNTQNNQEVILKRKRRKAIEQAR